MTDHKRQLTNGQKETKRQRPSAPTTSAQSVRWARGPDNRSAIGFASRRILATAKPCRHQAKTTITRLPEEPPVRNARDCGGLKGVAVEVFERYHGLNGQRKENFSDLAKECKERYNVTENALVWLVVGQSYNEMLGDLRKQVPDYPFNLKGRGRKGRGASPLMWLASENSSNSILMELRRELGNEPSLDR